MAGGRNRAAARARAIAALLWLAAGAPLRAAAADASLEDLLRELDGPGGMDAVARVQLLRLHTSAETRVAASERYVHDNAQTRCEMPFTPAQSADFLLALHASAPTLSGEGADLRWGAVFLDRQGVAVHRIYGNGNYFLVGLGRLGYLDGIGVALRPDMGRWFKRSLADCQRAQQAARQAPPKAR
jgi:hypothetical protein